VVSEERSCFCVCVCVCVCEADVFVVAWGARCGSGRDHGRRRRNQTKSKGDARVVAGRAGEGRHQLRKDYKKKKREKDRARGADRGGKQTQKKEGGRPLSPRLFFYTDGKKNSREPHEIHETFPFCFFVRFVRSSSFLVMALFLLLLLLGRFQDPKTTRIRQMEKTFDFI
jgi:hypothetical protein